MNEDRIYQLLRLEQSAKLDDEERTELTDLRSGLSADVKAIEGVLAASADVISFSDDQIDESWNDVITRLESSSEAVIPMTKKRSRRSLLTLMGLAASLLIVASVYFLLPAADQLFATEQEIQSFDLVDGSYIAANKASKIVVDRNFNDESRNLNVSGEVYIEAEKASIPMLITSEQFTIRVLGTRFNVLDYPTGNISSVSLHEGSIQLTLPNGTELTMQAGEHICWNKASKSIVKSTIKSLKPAWVDGGVDFENVLFEEVFERLERNHGISFSGKDLLDELHFNYSAPNENLEDIIAQIQLATGTTIKKSDQNSYTIAPKG